MSETPKHPPKSFRIPLTPNSKPSNAQEAAEHYLTSGEVTPRNACREAIACLFSPLGTALAGGSQAEVEAAIAASQSQFAIFMALAQNRCRREIASSASLVKPTSNTNAEAAKLQLTPTKSNGQPAQLKEPDQLIDLENERF